MQRPEPLAWQHEVQAQGREHWCRVEEYRHVRGRGQLQAFGNEQKLQAEQRAGQQASAPGAGHLIPTAAKTHQQPDQNRRHA
ncbi:hypothetical protein D3C86_2010900 [compost metagenome]